jgi:putative component of membrane protein insertase Oxa1/YidC/SpoIIIJ protein YidD
VLLSRSNTARMDVGKMLAVAAISFYQTYISPYKGFHCPHRVHRGGLSCSEYGKHVIGRHGLLVGGQLILERFGECALSARVMKFATPEATGRAGGENPFAEYGCPCAGCFFWLDPLSCCGPF